MQPDFQQRFEAGIQGTHALVDLDAYAGNVASMRQQLPGGSDVELMAVVKANAYGHGLVMIAQTAIEAGVGHLGVARVEEGLQLRRNRIAAPILALGPFNPELVPEAAQHGIAITIGSPGGLERVQRALTSRPGPEIDVHLKVDTGMHRFGVLPKEVVQTARLISGTNGVRLAGIFTHFATADEANAAPMLEQLARFESVQRDLAVAGIEVPMAHITNSASALRGVETTLHAGTKTLVRAGLALYGMAPSPDVPLPDYFNPVLTLKTRLGRVFDLPSGEGVSYGLTHIAHETTRCGTVPIGYGDGLNRLLSNRGWMSVGGARCPILGRVCMDQTVVDLSAANDASEGDEVVVIGAAVTGAMTTDNAASIIGTINYEITTALLPRVARVYTRRGSVVAVEDLWGLIERA